MTRRIPSEKQPACLGHVPGSSSREMKEDNITPAVIPGWCTSLLQPLDVCLNKPFKTKMCEFWCEWMISEFWCEWMISGDKEYMAGGNLKRPSLNLMTKWIHKAWPSIPTETVVNSFKKCGISNSMDSTEDDSLYSDLIGSPKKATDETEESTNDNDYYNNIPLSELQLQLLFGEDNEEEFLGFSLEDIHKWKWISLLTNCAWTVLELLWQ